MDREMMINRSPLPDSGRRRGATLSLCGSIIVFCLLSVLVPFAIAREAQTIPSASVSSATTLYLFSGKGCPHCEKEKQFLESLKRKYPTLTVKEYEVWYDRENAKFFASIMHSAGRRSAGVPATIVGKKLFFGFNEQTAASIEDAVSFCMEQGCSDPIASLDRSRLERTREEPKKITLPLVGEVDPATLSLPLLTVVIGGLDSFNPCAFFVLLFLLSMLIHAHSRRKMLLIGGIFVFFSGLIYFLIMAAWLNIFLIMGRMTGITMTAGIVALVVAVVNIKDFFLFKKGFSLVIPEQATPKLFERMRKLVRSSSLPATLAGTIVLAVSANAYELLCTAGFPMVYTRALTLRNLTMLEYYLYLVLYNVVYVIPLAVIVLVMTATLGSRKLTEWQGRQLKLLSGLMMFLLGLVLLVDPALLNNAAASAVLLGAVIILSVITICAVKRLRPGLAAS